MQFSPQLHMPTGPARLKIQARLDFRSAQTEAAGPCLTQGKLLHGNKHWQHGSVRCSKMLTGLDAGPIRSSSGALRCRAWASFFFAICYLYRTRLRKLADGNYWTSLRPFSYNEAVIRTKGISWCSVFNVARSRLRIFYSEPDP